MPGLIQCGVGCQLQSHCCLYCPEARRKVLPDRILSPPTCQASAQGCSVPMGRGSAVQVAVWPGSSESWVGLLGPLWFAPSILYGPVQVEGQAASDGLGSSHVSSQVGWRNGRCAGTGSGPCLLSFPQGCWKHHLPNLSIWKMRDRGEQYGVRGSTCSTPLHCA